MRQKVIVTHLLVMSIPTFFLDTDLMTSQPFEQRWAQYIEYCNNIDIDNILYNTTIWGPAVQQQ